MRFDDLARRAADDVRSRAERGPRSDFAAWRRRRGLRTAASVVGVGLATIFAISLGASLGEDDPDLAIDTSLAPEVATTTTVPRTDPTTAGPDTPVGLLGAGWERLDFGPLTVGRSRMAATWTGARLFVWGGHLGESPEAPPASEFFQDGYLYDPVAKVWTPTGRPLGLCQLGLARAIPVEGGVIVHGSVSIGGGITCARAARYDLAAGDWTALRSPLFESVSSRSPLADTGEMLVAPGAGLAWNYRSDETFDIPRLPADAAGDGAGTTRAHWTGSEVVVVGSGLTYAWAPGDGQWRAIEEPPIPTIGRDSVMTDEGLLAVEYTMAAAVFDGTGWAPRGGLPLRFYECLPEAVSAGGTPVVRMCSGIAVWDGVAGHWLPIPLEDVTTAHLGTLVGAGDSLYSVGTSLRRFRFDRDDDGSLVAPPTIPVGVEQLDLPPGWVLQGTHAPLGDSIEGSGFVFSDDAGRTCAVQASYGAPTNKDGLDDLGPTVVSRPGRPMLLGTARVDPANGYIELTFPDDNGTDWVTILCGGPDATTLSDAATDFAVGLWSPWEVDVDG